MLLRLVGVSAAVLGLAACMTVDLPEGSFAARGGLGPVSERLADRMQTCWFESSDEAFAPYRQETEISSLSGQPRIILVDRDDRGGLPQLVVSLQSVRGAGTVVSAFGPLTQTPLVDRINADVSRWARGSRACEGSA
ncbi:MAG: hypothetical protein ACFB01_03835 [Cohaesibacteraceae bacterium]